MLGLPEPDRLALAQTGKGRLKLPLRHGRRLLELRDRPLQGAKWSLFAFCNPGNAWLKLQESFGIAIRQQ